MNKLMKLYRKNPNLLGSPFFVAILECLLEVPVDRRVTSLRLYGLTCTSDGYLMGADSGGLYNHFLAPVSEVLGNVRRLCNHFEVPDAYEVLADRVPMCEGIRL